MTKTWTTYLRELAANGGIDPYHLKNAKRLLKGEFAFEDAYAMEAAPTVYTMDPPTWQHSPNGDPEWLYMLKRQEYLLDLLCAYQLTGELGYLRGIKKLIFDWRDHNLADESTWRTIDTGIRLVNWTAPVAALVEAGLLSAAEQRELAEAVQQQAEYLHDHYRPKDLISNWGVLEVTGILTYDAAHASVIAPALVSWAQAQLAQQLDLQVNEQGVHWEQSPLYLLEVWRSALTVVAASRAHDRAVPAWLLTKLRALQTAAAHFLRPDLTLVQQGDTDAIRIDSLYNASCALLALPTALQARMAPRFDYLMLALAHTQWPQPTTGPTLPRTFFEPLSGNYLWRSDWGAQADFWHVFNGSLGSGHGHASLGHVDLVMNGQPVLVDPGRLTYVDGAKRRGLKAATAHNTITLNGRSLSQPTASWTYAYVSAPLATQVQEFATGTLVKMVYRDRSDPAAIVTRRWLSLPAYGLWVMADQVAGAQPGTWQTHWQISPDLEVTALTPHHLTLGTAAELFTTMAAATSAGPFAAHYNHEGTLTRVTGQAALTAFSQEATVFAAPGRVQEILELAPIYATGGAQATPAEAWVLRIALQGGTNLLLTLQPEREDIDRKLFLADGTPAYGACNLFVRRGQQVVTHWQLL
ncbi:heparinase II/III family protein [Lacticaseibacillus sp. 53-4]|uniref:heparinase II/III domain-containing protein n=1 Tax=Lacticaseibacillus sp. 53-4 TaxID=2799575 RepID=UPI001943AD55|nr:heparinase II/III family protein [Lacticaseibacillus sp. 53-4]